MNVPVFVSLLLSQAGLFLILIADKLTNPIAGILIGLCIMLLFNSNIACSFPEEPSE